VAGRAEPEEAKEYFPGLAFSSAISSLTFSPDRRMTTSMKVIASRLIAQIPERS